MTSILSVVLGLLVLGVLVFVHELGHFLAAKACKIRVLAFSLGFGTPILKKTIGDTEYRISSIPFGGYVKMAGENPEEEKKGDPGEFTSKPVIQRAFVAIAGPAANFVFAFALLWIMFILGVQKPSYFERPIIGAVVDSSAAAIAGFKAGDSLVQINGKPVHSWEDFESALARQERQYKIALMRRDQLMTLAIEINPEGKMIPDQPTGGILPPVPAIVGEVNGGSPAEKAGMKPGDIVTEINSDTVFSWFELMEKVQQNHEAAPMAFKIFRADTSLTLSLIPTFDSAANRNLIGIRAGEGKSKRIKYPIGDAFGKSIDKSWEYTIMIFDVLGKLFSRKVSVNQLSGPVGIIPASGLIALQGLAPILNFMALIGINLAVLNLMPLVITDGGLLLFLLIEAIRRKPLSLKTQLMINKVAIGFFLLLFLLITFNDIRRLPEFFKFFGR